MHHLTIMLVILAAILGCQPERDICYATLGDFIAAYGKDVPRFDLDKSGRVDGADLELWRAECGG